MYPVPLILAATLLLPLLNSLSPGKQQQPRVYTLRSKYLDNSHAGMYAREHISSASLMRYPRTRVGWEHTYGDVRVYETASITFCSS